MTQIIDTARLPAASTTASGISELAINTEVNTGNDATRAVTPDALAGSEFGRRYIKIKVIDDATALTTGDGKATITIPFSIGMNLVGVRAHVFTVSTSGLPTIMVYNLTDTSEMMSVGTTIDENELDSKDATTGPTINVNEDDVVEGDVLRIDVDVAGTGTKGLEVDLIFQLP